MIPMTEAVAAIQLFIWVLIAVLFWSIIYLVDEGKLTLVAKRRLLDAEALLLEQEAKRHQPEDEHPF